MTVAVDSEFARKLERARGTKTFGLRRPEGFEHAPGQYAFFAIPADDDAEKWLLHHFTISSSPTEPLVEFTTRMTGHPYKERLDAIEPGTTVRIDGPHGTFTPDAGMGKICFVCGGIGITPARSTIRWAVDTGSDLDIVVLYANRDSASAAFREEFAGIHSKRIRVVDVLSDPEPGWAGPTGRIDATIVREQLPDLDERHFFVSGPPAMVEALSRVLADELRVPPNRLMTEDFLGYK